MSPGGPGKDRNLLLDKVEVLCGSGPTDGGVEGGGTDSGGSDGGGGADSGTCTPANCGDRLPCQVGTCTATGCAYAPAANGTSCSDGNACTVADQCASGTCTGAPIDLSAPACLTKTCDPVLGVVQTPSPAGTSCANGTLCDGDEKCNGAGTCSPGTPPVVDDGQACTNDACDPVLGVTHTPRPAGDPICSNGNVCDGLEVCSNAGTCLAGTPPAVDDGNICTVDACTAGGGVTHTAIAGCDPTPVQADAPYEARASVVGRVVSSSGGPVTGATFTVYDERATGAPRADVVATTGSNGGFRLRLTSFPEAEPTRSPPHRLVVVVDSPSTLRAYRVAYAHPGDSVDLGTIRLVGRDPKITNIGPAGGTASDSQGRVEIVIPPGALTTTLPIQITPFANREDFPAPLPDSTITMYGFEAEPSGTQFAVPVTVRVANYRNFPTTLAIPLGSYDEVENRWEHDSVATWDGTRFAGTTTHFSEKDLNDTTASDRVLMIARSPNPNKSAGLCGAGSSWSAGGGSITQAFALPGTHAGGEDLSLSLHYDSGLAGSRKPGATSPSAVAPGPAGTLATFVGGVTVKAFCVARGAAAPSATQPGTCVVAGGSCGMGGGSLSTRTGMLGWELDALAAMATNAQEASFGGWVELPIGPSGQLPSTGYVTQTVKVMPSLGGAGSGKACVGSTTFGVSDPLAPRTQINAEEGAQLQATRKVLLHHRFTSPYGAGWGVREISRLFTTGGAGVLVTGDGQEEEFRPRARLSTLSGGLAEQAFGRDDLTGELFVASAPGTIARIDPVTNARTTLLTGLAFPSEFEHALAIAYVGGVRHFVVGFASRVLDIAANGTQRQVATRNPALEAGNSIFGQVALAGRGASVFYTAGDLLTPVLYRIDLSQASPTPQAISSLTGDVRLDPRATLSGVKFGHPLGLAVGPDGALYVADPRRNVVYRVSPDGSGAISANSAVTVALGNGDGRQLLQPGETQPARAFTMNQPARLSMGEDGKLLVLTSYGVTSFDPLAREAELVFLHSNGDEVIPSLSGGQSTPASFVALNATTLFSRTYNASAVRVDIDPLASESDPTRTLRALGGGGHELVDTTAGMVWRYEASGRLVEQRKRTGEIDFTVSYVDARSDAVDHVTNAVGGQWKFAYAGGKLDSITDPAGGRTRAVVSAQGDLTSFVDPEGDAHTFTYDAHHMASKTSSRGDTTSYTFNPDGTVATSTKPGNESYSFETVPVAVTSYDATGRLVRTGSYTDPRGVRHDLVLNVFGAVERDTYTADGVTRVVDAVHPSQVGSSEGLAMRNNVFLRSSHRTVNGVRVAPPVEFDSLGRPVLQRRVGGGSGSESGKWIYSADGWLAESLDGPSAVSQHFERDAAGHVLRIYDGRIGTGGTPTGRESTFTWRADGQPATMTTHGVTTTFAYDDAGGSKNLVGATDTLGRTFSLGYDARGNVTTASDGTTSSFFVFDADNRLKQSRDALGNITTLRYTHEGCGCTERDLVTGVHTPDLPAGVEWTMAYGAQGRLASVTDPHGFTESYTYETTGEVKTIKDRLDRTTTVAHDQLGRMLSLVDTLGRKHQRSYTVPVAGALSGPSLDAASANGTATSTSLTASLRSGDYQIGVNAHDVEGYPAQISFYRDATFALGYTSYFDSGGRLTYRADRTSRPIDSAVVPVGGEQGAFAQELFSYDSSSSAPLVSAVEARRTVGIEPSNFSRNIEQDVVAVTGSGPGIESPASYVYTRDTGGRVTQITTRLISSLGAADAPVATAVYRPDGRLSKKTNADGVHDFTYDSRGLLATQTVSGEGVYTYGYDEVGRNTALTFPDSHVRRQIFDDLGRITSRCYEYPSDHSKDRCYSAQYDAVGNPVRLTAPEGADIMVYDALDRLKSVTREIGGVTSAVETYDFNALGALKVNAGATLDHQRPRLAGGGLADAAVPATLSSQPVTLDAAGRVTSLRGVTFGWTFRGYPLSVTPPAPALAETYTMDAYLRRVSKVQGSSVEYYAYDGADRIAVLGPNGSGPGPGAPVRESYLFDGIDHPLRMKRGTAFVYYELDLAGNVRQLRGPDGSDLGGYRYTAFGKTVVDDTVVVQPLRWKARWWQQLGANEIYDVRARQWSPELGSFLSVDEYAFQDPTSTLWGWPNNNPLAWSDPSGRSRVRMAPSPLDAVSRDAARNSNDLWDFAGTDYRAGNYLSAYFHGALALDMAAISIGAGVVPAVFDVLASAEGGGGKSCPARPGGAVRLPSDVAVNPTPPPAKPLTRPIGKSATQNAQLAKDIEAARLAGGRNFRVNQQQVNADGDRVGVNRPDLQYTDANGQRIYTEYDTPSSGRGPGHEARIEANDPTGVVDLKIVP